MHRRKVIRQGKGTLTMSLPSTWIRKTRLRPGDDLMVAERGQDLLVSPAVIDEDKRVVELSLKGLSKYYVYSVIENLYIRGEDELRLRYGSDDAFDAISAVVRLLIGFEVVEHREGYCVVKELARADKADFDVILRRIFILLVSMAEDAVAVLKQGSPKRIFAMAKRDMDVNVLVSYCMRVLNRHENALDDPKHLYALLILLENLGDEYARLFKEVKRLQPNTIDIASHTAALLRMFYELYYRFSKDDAEALRAKRDEIKRRIDSALKRSKARDDIIALHHFRTVGDVIINIEKFHLVTQVLGKK